MTIQEALHTATEAGYQVNSCDGIEAYYHGANNEYSVWIRKDNDSSFIVVVAETFLDPFFWQALGSGLGWGHELITVHEVENGRPTIVTRVSQHWLYHWHRFLDFLAEGKTAEDFFATLGYPRKAGRFMTSAT